MSKLRKYQDRDLNMIIESFKKDDSILYQLPTGGGKSLVIEHFVLKIKKKKILILAHKRELVFQIRARLQENGLKVGIIIGDLQEDLDASIIVASVRTVTREKRIELILKKKFDQIIVDEAHHIRTSSYENVLDQIKEQNPKLKLLGVTATPYRKDKKALNKYFDVLICSETIASLQDQGFLAKYKVYYTPVTGVENVKNSGNDYQIQALGDYMRNPKLLDFLVESYKQRGEDNQMIVFCVDKKHAKAVKQKYEEKGYTSIEHIDSDTKLKRRAEILEDFKNNKLKIITCIETLTEGIDLPECKCIQLARPTRSLVLYLQMIGRGARPKKDGSCCIILDNAGCTIEHKSPNADRAWSLDPTINPSDPLRKHKVVGVRKDGSYTEDEDEMAFLELIELTDEEYALNMVGGIERSEEENKKTDKKCKDILKELGEFIISKAKNKELTISEEDMNSDYWETEKVYFVYKGKKISFIWKSKYKDIELKENFYSYDEESFKIEKEIRIIIGKITELFMNEKHLKVVLDKFEEIEQLQDDKIDIHSLRSKKREFDELQDQIKLETHLLTNNIIKLEKTFHTNPYFRDLWGSYDIIEFSRNKLMATNIIKLTNSETGRTVNDVSIKKDKVLDILKNKAWK